MNILNTIKNKFGLSPKAQENPQALIKPEVVLNSISNPWLFSAPDYDQISNKIAQLITPKDLSKAFVFGPFPKPFIDKCQTPTVLGGGGCFSNRFTLSFYNSIK